MPATAELSRSVASRQCPRWQSQVSGEHVQADRSRQGEPHRVIVNVAPGIPPEIEAVLLSHPAVTAAAVVGIPDRFWGEIVGAAITTSAATPPTGAELTGFCRARLAAHKIPVRWLFTSDFPLTATGKIRKDVLSAQLAEADAPVTAHGSSPADKIFKRQTGRPGDLGQPAAAPTPEAHRAQE